MRVIGKKKLNSHSVFFLFCFLLWFLYDLELVRFLKLVGFCSFSWWKNSLKEWWEKVIAEGNQ